MEIASRMKLIPLVQIKINNNQTTKICYENIVNAALIKKKAIHTIFHNIFHKDDKFLLILI